MHPGPVGIFDSGLGGLSVWREVRKLLPHEPLIYYADSARCPYGPRPAAEIRQFSGEITRWLLDRGCKLIVVACNTATAAAISWLREQFEVEFVGMEPAVKPAAAHTRTGHIGILATRGTFGGAHFQRAVERFAAGVEVHVQPGDGLVELVEQGRLDGPETEALLRRYLEPMLGAGCDQIVLGCTHYPFLLPAIRRIAGPEVQLIDPAPAVARRVRELLHARGLEAPADAGPLLEAFTSGDPASFASVLSRAELAGLRTGYAQVAGFAAN
ncbi:MAG: glutamate racemase [Bacteroidia bacterium]|nr:glutamate racemase [Bacteroidia bacterium]